MMEEIVLALLAPLSQVLHINRQLHQFFLFSRGGIHPGSWAAFSFANLRARSACCGATGPAVPYMCENLPESFLQHTKYWSGFNGPCWELSTTHGGHLPGRVCEIAASTAGTWFREHMQTILTVPCCCQNSAGTVLNTATGKKNNRPLAGCVVIIQLVLTGSTRALQNCLSLAVSRSVVTALIMVMSRGK